MLTSTLFVVSTPIGNLADMTPRALEVLKSVAVIAAEDTRHSKKLMNHFGINTPLIPCHDHNERQQAQGIIQRLQNGDSVALISDAGTPLISDPGFYLVRAVREAGFKVVPVVGACAVIAALSVSGLPTDRFYFEGFLPAKSSSRLKRLETLKNLPTTWVVYESPHRIQDSLEDMCTVLGSERYITVARELTKTFETVLFAPIEHILQIMEDDPNQRRGEFVVLVEGFVEPEVEGIPEAAQRMMRRLMDELPTKKAASVVADLTGCRKNELYQWALEC